MVYFPYRRVIQTCAGILIFICILLSVTMSKAQSASTLQRNKEAFSTKLQHFKMMLARLGYAQGSRLKFNIRRDHLLEDAYEHVMKSDCKHLQKKRLTICFKGEEG